MRPILFELFGLPVHAYGFFLGLTFIVGSVLTWRELPRKGSEPRLSFPVTTLAILMGVVGGKLASVIDRWQDFRAAPVEFLVGGSGFAYLGGFVLATGAVALYLRTRRVSFLRFADATAPGLAFGYGVARIGCHLAGDGDYGVATDLPWGMAYPRGLVPVYEPVHPTPIYETLAAFALGALLWKLRKRSPGLADRPDGWLFCLYLVLSATTRFLVEIVRRNPQWAWGLTQAQWISLALIAAGLYGLWRLSRNPKPKMFG